MNNILVFGSINLDLVTRTHRLPKPGETLRGISFFTASGGKGANQAVAAAKLGMTTFMIGRVGGDSFGQELLESLQQSGVKCDRIFIDKNTASGIATIAVEDTGENTIVIVPGANDRINESDCDRLTDLLPDAAALLLQLEIPLSSVLAAAKKAQNAGIPVILDPAPARELPPELYSVIDIITPNETELSILTGIAVRDIETAREALTELQKRGVKTAIAKLGAKGVLCARGEEQFFVPAFEVEAVDTVAAGDAFNGALAVAIAQGLPLPESVRWGAAAGALTVTKPGAQSALPSRLTFEEFLREGKIKAG
ncbi:ribokinase [Laspinema olomoucense]|uniref:Ribokinase n=1 Tax=Laspinema olomoucense D3b TaxID=2953688 RepID=A0ABT2N3G9_9CYAN|nr:ribokinase [Laspinema sp. D3b]MCT7976305.1 ribokinase [Laspinema sp. D3b]